MMKRRDALKEMLAPVAAQSVPDPNVSRVPAKPGALKSMGLSLQSLSDEAESAHALRERLESGEVVIEIDPQSIVPAFIRDRLSEFSTIDVSDLEVSIAESGQQVPILVRPSPDSDGQYQVAYGHRRVEACRRLGRPVKAIVRRLTDQELVTAQGKENLEREDLSFIERAMFAARLEDRGFDRSVLMAALGVHKGNLSTMIAVARGVPEELILAIGPAPKIGRPRWEHFADMFRRSPGDWKKLVGSAGFAELPSDARFVRALSALTPRPRQNPERLIRDEQGRSLAQIEQRKDRVRLTIDDKSTSSFGTYLVEQLPEIYAAFRRRVAE